MLAFLLAVIFLPELAARMEDDAGGWEVRAA